MNSFESRLARLVAGLVVGAALMVAACGPRGSAKVPYDLQFIDAMVAHHQGAIDMAGPAESLALRPELKEFARKVVADQSAEVALMTAWREQWYKGRAKVPTIMTMPGMNESMKGMDLGHLRGLSGAAYDLMFVEMMVPHHEGAITMAREAQAKAEHAEVKQLAQAIIDAQQAEIEMMNRWQAEWRTAR
ncbi:MAG: DUF305 domain-containing protein [bacterium]